MTSNSPAASTADSATPAGDLSTNAGVTGAAARQPQRDRIPAPARRAALVTGCSSGIGHATALWLHAAGFDVYATARRTESLADLTAAGIRSARLDVTSEASMAGLISRITADHGAVGVLVNNAGFELDGPVEEVPLAARSGLRRFRPQPVPGPRQAERR